MSQEKGKLAEEFVGKELKKQGYLMVTKNFFCRAGEIDLIMKKNNTISFIEVRSRSSQTRFGSGADTVTKGKQKKIIASAKIYIHQHPQSRKTSYSFDVADVYTENDSFRLNWIPNAFDLEGQFSAF